MVIVTHPFLTLATSVSLLGYNFGTKDVPRLHNLLLGMSTGSDCRQHIVFSTIFTENLSETFGTPVTLTKGSKYVLSQNEIFHSNFRLNIFKDREWTCQHTILYLNIIPSFNPVFSKLLGNWLTMFGERYLFDTRNFRVFPDNFFFLVVTQFDMAEILESNFPIYNRPGSFHTIPNIGLLFLSNQSSTCSGYSICYNYKEGVIPLISNFKCAAKQSLSEIAESFMKIVSPRLDPGNWKAEISEEILPRKARISIYIFNLALSSANRSLFNVSLGTVGKYCFDRYHEICFLQEFSMIGSFAVLNNELNKNLASMKSFKLVQYEGLSFLSCHTDSRITFSIYLAPFYKYTWISIAICLLVLSILVGVLAHFSLGYSDPFIIFYFFGCLIDEVSYIPSKLQNLSVFRQISLPWLLVGSLLSNCYIGLLIENINAPLPATKFETFAAITCASRETLEIDLDKLLVRRDEADALKLSLKDGTALEVNVPLEEYECFSLLSGFVPEREDPWEYPPTQIYGINPETYELHWVIRDTFPGSGLSGVSSKKKIAEWYFLSNHKLRRYPVALYDRRRNISSIQDIKEATEEEIVSCGKSAFVDWEDNVRNYLRYLTRFYPGIEFYVSKENIIQPPIFHSFFCSKNAIVFTNFIKLGEAGINEDVVNKFSAITDSVKEENYTKSVAIKIIERLKLTDKVSPLNLESSVQTVFVILGICLAFSANILLIEKPVEDLKGERIFQRGNYL
ncbi:putative anion transporter 6 [Folsomia candida]|uniref:Putative anion transporter 6 n=1 Tax=Folsomia candida TaxID=158441 RepID=A0A226E9Y9_FOLCA|nr:putative anion transporter 6 [Folsomia candida]